MRDPIPLHWAPKRCGAIFTGCPRLLLQPGSTRGIVWRDALRRVRCRFVQIRRATRPRPSMVLQCYAFGRLDVMYQQRVPPASPGWQATGATPINGGGLESVGERDWSRPPHSRTIRPRQSVALQGRWPPGTGRDGTCRSRERCLLAAPHRGPYRDFSSSWMSFFPVSGMVTFNPEVWALVYRAGTPCSNRTGSPPSTGGPFSRTSMVLLTCTR